MFEYSIVYELTDMKTGEVLRTTYWKTYRSKRKVKKAIDELTNNKSLLSLEDYESANNFKIEKTFNFCSFFFLLLGIVFVFIMVNVDEYYSNRQTPIQIEMLAKTQYATLKDNNTFVAELCNINYSYNDRKYIFVINKDDKYYSFAIQKQQIVEENKDIKYGNVYSFTYKDKILYIK